MNLFKKDPKILTIEVNDQKINEDLCHLIVKLEKNISELQNLFGGSDVASKNEKLSEILNMILQLKQDVTVLKGDVNNIIDIELQEKEYILIKDDTFLKDKVGQLEIVEGLIQKIQGVLSDHPSMDALKAGLLEEIVELLNQVIDSLNKIRGDDTSLQKIYTSLRNV